MRYYLAQCEYKWSHADTNMEHIWIRRELGEDLYTTIESNGWEWCLLRTSSTSLPGDIYCRCDIYVESNNDKLDTVFQIKFPQSRAVPKSAKRLR